ncbi:B3 domain-containing transcription factor ABI3 [Impatiens glandulifera]|uniref:B3 domain-containing transcription factor ABI3 n=1 Tax=Impatiens glandulifera TaxID=253017 RepID=UPI001FB11F25|nr:B3 domain-containing transcription factor ABI3 [Impatiens glandulifera]
MVEIIGDVQLDGVELDSMEVERSEKVTGGEIWPVVDDDDDRNHENIFIDINEPSIFYNDFPPLTDFPCMSSSSSTSSTPAAANPIATSSSSSSWAIIKSDVKEDHEKDTNLLHAGHPFKAAVQAKTGDGGICGINCMDDYFRENFGYMDSMDSNEIWDPSSIFQIEDDQKRDSENNNSDDLGKVFYEWLKSNKEHITAEDVRNIKLRKSTVESAEKRLGSSKEGKKQLLKLILDWVQQSQLQKRRMREESEMAVAAAELTNQTNPNVSTWLPPQQPYPVSPVMVGYMAPETYSSNIVNHHPTASEYHHHPHAPEPPQTWPPAIRSGSFTAAMVEYRRTKHQYPYPAHYYRGLNGEKLVRLGSSATKEARQKRMARQRRFKSRHPRHNHQNHHQPTSRNLNQTVDEQGSMILGPDTFANGNSQTNSATHSNWVYWPASGSGIPVMTADEQPAQQHPISTVDTVRPQQQKRLQLSIQRRQGFKSEKNLKYLLQKVLKQSDVGNLGRIVLPKKEAETHLPELEGRDGISIAMEDVGTSRVWNMRYRYRFWPNNKSRMYLLENTGDFVRANGLQEGDFIVIYKDVKCGKYLIRGVKVRQTEEMMEVKKPAKGHRSHRYALGNTSTTSLQL